MERIAYKELLEWKQKTDRQPLILQGVRQCGKTWLLKTFGEQEFEDTAYFNFEHTEQLFGIFEQDLDPKRIIFELGILRNQSIIPGKTLLILDEIQMCPRALTALKYFAENLSSLHVAAAGSLLGVTISQMQKNVSYPVGKVQTLTLYPLNFEEFVLANGETLLHDSIKTGEGMLPAVVLGKLESLYRKYLITGGMPAAVSAWLASEDVEAVDRILDNIILDYERDFIKYAPRNEYPKLSLIWKGIPAQIARDNQKFVFSHIKTGARARDLEDALHWLLSAGLIYQVTRIEQPNIPLSTFAERSYFKIYLSDVGLLRRMSRFPSEALFDSAESTAYMRGILAENFVLTELMTNKSHDAAEVCFWKSGGIAEVDFLIQSGCLIIPIEVKSGKNTRARSLFEYRKKYAPKCAVKTSLQRPQVTADEAGVIREIPLYLLWAADFKKCEA